MPMSAPKKPNIRPGLWRDIVEDKTIYVIGLALDESDLVWFILWREENDNKQLWAKKLTHWNVRTDDGKKRFVEVK